MAKPLSKTVVVAYGRSAVAKSGKKGALRNLHPIDMGGLVLKGVMEKIPKLDPALVEDVILGCAIPEAKQGLNPARLVAARAGLPYTACGLTVDRFCSSSLQAVALAAWQIEAGQADCIVAGGIESMTALPMTLDRSGDMDPWLLEHDPAQYISNGETAENVAEKYNVTREEMDRLALESHRKAAAAQDAGYFDEQIIPLPGVDAEGNEIVFDKDQGIRRDTTLEKLSLIHISVINPFLLIPTESDLLYRRIRLFSREMSARGGRTLFRRGNTMGVVTLKGGAFHAE